MSINFNRREFGLLSSASAVGIGLPWSVSVAEKQDFAFRYILASCMYGYTDIRKIIPEVKSRLFSRIRTSSSKDLLLSFTSLS